jgi:2'-5' RNA ligase
MKRIWLACTLSCLLSLAAAGSAVVKSGITALENPPPRGNLFSAILFGATPLGRRWAALRPQAEKLFPALKMKAVEDLHVTVVYIGRDWAAENLPLLRRAMADVISAPVRLAPGIAIIGRNRHVVVVDLKGLPQPMHDRVVRIKEELNRAGLKKPEAYDASFRPHVTLAEAGDKPPTEEQAQQLNAFQAWIAGRLDLSTLDIVLDPALPVQLLLAEASRPAPIPEYITVESFLETSR